MTKIDASIATSSSTMAWRDYAKPPLPPLLQAALDCFVESGYHGTSIRTIASRAGLSVPGYYHHYASKHAILAELMRAAMTELYDRSVAAASEAGDSARAQFANSVECLVLFHAHRSDLAFIASSEIRALEPEARAEHIRARDRQQGLLEAIVRRGIAAGELVSNYPDEAVRALITMCTGVSQWYRLDGPLLPEELAARYVAFGLRMFSE